MSDEKKIELPVLRALQTVGNVMNVRPTDWNQFDIPKKLKDSWKAYLNAKDDLKAVMAEFDIDPTLL